MSKTAIIIGAGPAGLTAAYELLEKSDIKPVIYEMSGEIGGVSKTVNYKGNRIDIGGHRFFSKSDRVMDWWRKIMPLQGRPARDAEAFGRKVFVSKAPNAPDPEETDLVMLIRSRLSRIFYLRKFFDYPIALNFQTLSNLGLIRLIRIIFSYLKVRFFPIKPEKSLADFYTNRFGRELYNTFFRDYSFKVWGVSCEKISPDWGVQRVKGVSLTKAVLHAVRSVLGRDISVSQKGTETSLIGQFMYPKFGPGQLWEEVARQVQERGGEVHLNRKVVGLRPDQSQALREGSQSLAFVEVQNTLTGETETVEGDYFFSTMPVQDLVRGLGEAVSEEVREVAEGLVYRDFITVGLLLKGLEGRALELSSGNSLELSSDKRDLIPDNWIYIQERDVKLGRLQIFNNWSPYLVQDPSKVWIGLEYFCNEGDELWSKSDADFAYFAIQELAKIDIIDQDDVLDSVVIRMPKTYPAYFGSYDRFNVIREFVDHFENLFLVGRNGMHRYNNMDHSMLSAMTAVENIIAGRKDKSNIWAVNAEREYHEGK